MRTQVVAHLTMMLGVLTLSTASTRHNPAENRIGSLWFFFVAKIALVLFIRALCRTRQR